MLNDMLDQTAGAVLSRYPALLRQGPLSPLGNHGGFSGARLWRVAGLSGMLCLRAWPEHDSAVRLAWRHRLMAAARESGLRCVPTVFAARDQATWVEQAGRLWDLTEWLPGRADFHERPGRQRLEAAGRGLGWLHVAW